MSVASCGKPVDSLSRGLAKNGFDLSGMSWETAKTVAVDTSIIPLGTKILVVFVEKDYQKYNGVYIARDTGSAIVGNKLDFFMGDTVDPKDMDTFGVRKANVYILK